MRKLKFRKAEDFTQDHVAVSVRATVHMGASFPCAPNHGSIYIFRKACKRDHHFIFFR